VVLKPTTVVADEETEEALTSVTENQEVLNFTESTPQLDGLKVGDVLVMGPTDHTPEGLLRKVTGIDHSGSVVVSTEFATMEDAIEEGTIAVNATITAADVQATALGLEDIKVLEETEGVGFAIPLDITVSGLTFTGELTFNADPLVNINAGYWPPGLKELEFTIETNESLYVDVEGDADFVDMCERIPLMPPIEKHILLKIPLSFPPHIFPVYVVIYFTPVLVVEGDLSGQVQAHVEYDAQRKAGLHYKDGDWNLIKEQDTDFNGEAELGVEATLKASVGAEVTVKFYSVVGPTGNIFGYLEFKSELGSSICWELYGGLRAELGIRTELPILGWGISYGPVEVMHFPWLLAQGQCPRIIVHALNPEGVEIASIEGVDPYCVEIYDGDTLIGYGAHNATTYGQPIVISLGTHTIRVKFNGMTLEQNVNINAGQTQVLIFTFERTQWDGTIYGDPITRNYYSEISGTFDGYYPDTWEEDITIDETLQYAKTSVRFACSHDWQAGTFHMIATMNIDYSPGNFAISASAYNWVGFTEGYHDPGVSPHNHALAWLANFPYPFPTTEEGASFLIQRTDTFTISDDFRQFHFQLFAYADAITHYYSVNHPVIISTVPYDLAGTGIKP